jgi:NAD(P)-dependent dehydrogenase (short-subunit alcohol dehydrogenase family)
MIKKIDQNTELIATIDVLNSSDFSIFFTESDTVVYLSSILRAKRLEDQSDIEWHESFLINTILPIRIVKYLNEHFENFTFCYIGSESAYKGSFDDTYFLSKSCTQTFIEKFKLKSEKSRIFTIAPSTVLSGMTLNRKDKERLEDYKLKMRNKRFISLEEISKIIIELSSDKFQYLSNETVNLNFGKFAIYE